ncbi:dihydropteroate synthase [Microlunatus elymi]|uniref:Dihydropteroate synthase n=2 Tax=Microlunatus elymi TaxID=2596828 RepID=A0A516Q5U3_9ACTN|nr:dihydropteroate synthase [Microlunatus elymi]
MGVVNVTPDSFSDGGDFFRVDKAIQHGRDLIAEGADLVDVGGESTRPGAVRVDQDEELRRVIPVITELAAEPEVRTGRVAISVDTMRPAVARQAVAAGAKLINDVSGGQADPAMIPTAAELGCAYVLMHWRGHSADMQSRAHYTDVAAEVRDELARQAEHALAAGIAEDRLILDPGFGFAKTGEHNWELLQHLDVIASLGRPLLFGVSRKRFLGTLLAAEDGTPRPAKGRDDASAVLTGWAATHRIWGVRVHTVRPSRDAIAVFERLFG